MSLIGRIVVVMIALLIALMAAGVALTIGVIVPDFGLDTDPVERIVFFTFAFFATSFVGAVAMLPALLAIVFAEAARMRSFLYYGVCGALIGLIAYYGSDISTRLENTTDINPVGHALQLAAAAGIIGGLVYWLIAGRNAGKWRDYA
jgi:hypothetical protein